MDFRKNQLITAEITDFTAEGNGVGRVDGMAVFVPGTAPGDRVTARIIKQSKNYLVGKTEKLHRPSRLRVEPDCSVFSRCGGCSFRHISYEAECSYKQKRVADCLARIAKLPVEPEPLLSAENADHYRNKAQYPVGRDATGALQIGFYAPRSHRIVHTPSCRLQPEEFTAIIAVVSRWIEECGVSVFDEDTGLGLVRRLYMRKGFATGEIMVCVVANGDSLPKTQLLIQYLTGAVPAIRSISLNRNRGRTNAVMGDICKTLYGNGYIEDILCGVRFRLSPLSFYQVNHDQAQRLFEKAAEFSALTGRETVLDLYCGAGAIGLTMAGGAAKLIGVEIVPDAVEDARKNAEINGITNAEFICADAFAAAEQLSDRGEKPDVVLLDPPRKGCDPKLIGLVAEGFSPQRVVYVSCDPATFARDAALFAEKGYYLQRAVPVDMFPRTPHVETVGLFTPEKRQ